MPRATYRLQFSRRFTFTDAEAIVPYLAALGISHVYASPFLKARPGSEHGYDITDHNALNPEVGDWNEFVSLSDTLHDHGMGLILDFVPNHMGIGKSDNAWWLDVLEWGRRSPYSNYFDIDWAPPKADLRDKLLLPLLGDHYGIALASGDLSLKFDTASGRLGIWYHDHLLPLRPRSYAAVIRRQLGLDASRSLTADLRRAFEDLAEEFDRIHRAAKPRHAAAQRRAAELREALAALCRESPQADAFIASATSSYQGVASDVESLRPLHALLERQHYRLAFWRAASDEINYRRFFNINELAGIRVETRSLFDAIHGLVGRMIAEGRLHGLRLDHVDGLFDPEAYCRRLMAFARTRRPPRRDGDDGGFYVVAEKILGPHEALPSAWPIAGTTGYEFTSLVNGLFVDPDNEGACTEIYRRFAGGAMSFEEELLAAKDTVIDTLLAGELGVLANHLDRISERHWDTRDYTLRRLRDGLRAVVRHFPVYRTYVTSRRITAADRRNIEHAVGRARQSWRGSDREIFDFIHGALTGDLARRGPPFRRADVVRFAMRFQQYTGPVMAKSLEDTAFYRHHRLISLNEVGGDPRQFGMSLPAFHAANDYCARHWPHSMVTTVTHDTKRGEDARLRIDVLSELPVEWERRIRLWTGSNEILRSTVGDRPVPSANDEYLLYQALLGAWPAAWLANAPERDALARFRERFEAYAIKALREAKAVSSWDNPNEPYEKGLAAFVAGLIEPNGSNPFLTDFLPFATRIAWFGMLNSVSQTVLRFTVPGVPDTYQGSELWNLSFVDPDNRRPVDFALRRNLLREQSAALAGGSRLEYAIEKLAAWHDARIKLFVIATALAWRQQSPEVAETGSYEPLSAEGHRANNVIAFRRTHAGRATIIVVARLFVSLLGAEAVRYDGSGHFGDTMITGSSLDGKWHDALTDRDFAFDPGAIPLGDVLRHLPAAILIHDPKGR